MNKRKKYYACMNFELLNGQRCWIGLDGIQAISELSAEAEARLILANLWNDSPATAAKIKSVLCTVVQEYSGDNMPNFAELVMRANLKKRKEFALIEVADNLSKICDLLVVSLNKRG